MDKEVFEAISAAGLCDNVMDLGYCDHKKAVAEQRAASVLLLPLRNDPEYRVILPGKLFEYLAARRPILGIGQEDGAMAVVLKETGAGIIADWNNEKAVRDSLEAAWRAFMDGRIEECGGDVARFERRALTSELAGLLNGLVN